MSRNGNGNGKTSKPRLCDLSGVLIPNNSTLNHLLAEILNVETELSKLRRLMRQLGTFMIYEALSLRPTVGIRLRSPMGVAPATIFSESDIWFAAIQPAGQYMIDEQAWPEARIAKLGIFRDPKTQQPVQSWSTIPPEIVKHRVIVFDPLIANAGCTTACINQLIEAGVKPEDITVVSVMASVQGVKSLRDSFEGITIMTVMYSEYLTSEGNIALLKSESDKLTGGVGDIVARLEGTVCSELQESDAMLIS